MLVDRIKAGSVPGPAKAAARPGGLAGDYGFRAADMRRLLQGFSAMAATEPILNVPRSVTGVAVLLVVVQIIRGLLPDELDLTLLLALAFIPARYSGAALELPGGYLTAVTSFVTYMVVHAGWVHLVVNLVWMLAFGSAVARRMGDVRFLGFSVLCGIAGALTHLCLPLWRHGAGGRRLGGDLGPDGRRAQIHLQGEASARAARAGFRGRAADEPRARRSATSASSRSCCSGWRSTPISA